MTMLLRYIGDGKKVSFAQGGYYEARKIHDEIGEAWAIFDEGDDWYVYGLKFVEENFEEVTEDDFKTSRTV